MTLLLLQFVGCSGLDFYDDVPTHDFSDFTQFAQRDVLIPIFDSGDLGLFSVEALS